MFWVGCTLRVWPVFALGSRFSGLVAIQPGQTLVTTGIYRVVRNPSYLGMAVSLAGWSLTFRSGGGAVADGADPDAAGGADTRGGEDAVVAARERVRGVLRADVAAGSGHSLEWHPAPRANYASARFRLSMLKSNDERIGLLLLDFDLSSRVVL